jgi:hypothetical protein
MFRQQQELLEARRSGRTLQDASARRQKVSVSSSACACLAACSCARCWHTMLQHTAQHSTSQRIKAPRSEARQQLLLVSLGRDGAAPKAAGPLSCAAAALLACSAVLNQQHLACMAVTVLQLLVAPTTRPSVSLTYIFCRAATLNSWHAGDAS